MAWDYAELSSMAKENGGPQALIDQLQKTAFEEGKAQGKEEMEPILALTIVAAVGVGSLITWGFQKLRNCYEQKKSRQKELENIKKELIQKMTESDSEELHADPAINSPTSEPE